MSLLEVRAERARTESNVLQLANRIKLLERAEKNARKRIEKARSRAKTIAARREETAAARRRRFCGCGGRVRARRRDLIQYKGDHLAAPVRWQCRQLRRVQKVGRQEAHRVVRGQGR